MMNNLTKIALDGSDAVVTSGGHRFRVVPRDRAGADAGCPVHLLEAALGACITLTMESVATNKGIDASGIEVELERQSDGNGSTRFAVNVRLTPGLSDREQKILYRCAKLCDVGKILKGDVEIDYQLVNPT